MRNIINLKIFLLFFILYILQDFTQLNEELLCNYIVLMLFLCVVIYTFDGEIVKYIQKVFLIVDLLLLYVVYLFMYIFSEFLIGSEEWLVYISNCTINYI